MGSDTSGIANIKRFTHEAMATTFEVVVVHDDEQYARQAARAAFDEVDRLEAELSRFIENSDIARLNNAGDGESVIVGLDAFACLQLAIALYEETEGAFDITVGALVRCWRDDEGRPRRPSEEELRQARAQMGVEKLELNETEHTVRVSGSVCVDLGGIGKGYAVDRMGEVLREWDVDVALIAGGYSSVLALEAPPETKGWPVTFSDPEDRRRILARPRLRRRAVGASGIAKGGHIIDPRTGRPVKGKRAAWSSSATAAQADALSTAFMVMTCDQIRRFCDRNSGVGAVVLVGQQDNSSEQVLCYGQWGEGEILI